MANTDTGNLKSLHTRFDVFGPHAAAKFESNRMDQNVQNLDLFDKKTKQNKTNFYKTIF